MATILHALELPVIEALGWALVHFVWQAALIAGLLVVALIPLRRASARVRYLIECSVLFAMAVCPLATWGWIAATDRAPEAAVVIPIDGPIPAEESTPANAVEFAPMASVGPDFDALPDPQQVVTNPEPIELIHEPTAPPAAPISVSWPERFRRGLAPVLPWMVGAWLLGVIVLSLRLAVGWRVVQRLKRMAVTPPDDAWQTRMQKLARRLGVTRTVRLVESTLVEVPTVIGWLRPVILLPLSLLTSLTPQQLDAVLAHELAHIRRHDYLVNLLQTAIETLLFYHPAVWWLSSLIRREREHCCDDLALRMCDSPVTYVTALAKMEEFRTSPRLAVAASGGSLVSRIRRIALGPEIDSRRSVWWSASLVALTAVAMLGLATYFTTHADDSTNETKRSTATTNDAATATSEAKADEALPDSPPWGTITNGLRVRVVPVSDSMDETQVDVSKSVSSFETLDDVTLAVEIQNASDQPVALRELRYGANYGDSAGKLASDWFGQFLFSIEYFDAEGQRVERPELIPVGNRTEMTVDGALQTTIDPQQSVKMLLRPNRWISALSQQPLIGKQRAIVRYRGAVADKAVEVVAPAVEFSVTKRGYRPSGALPAQLWEDPKDNPELEQDISKQLVWGEPVNGLRAALDVVPESRGKGLSHGTKPKLKLVVQNVSDQPITLASLMWLSELPVTAKRDSPGSLREPTPGGAKTSEGAPEKNADSGNKTLDRGAIHDN
ncbi:MAG: M48 family metalloprotease, partial [Planctomycetales bacterium]|nr:M48 family metalloprotease [Planctomycetales bacterium]